MTIIKTIDFHVHPQFLFIIINFIVGIFMNYQFLLQLISTKLRIIKVCHSFNFILNSPPSSLGLLKDLYQHCMSPLMLVVEDTSSSFHRSGDLTVLLVETGIAMTTCVCEW